MSASPRLVFVALVAVTLTAFPVCWLSDRLFAATAALRSVATLSPVLLGVFLLPALAWIAHVIVRAAALRHAVDPALYVFTVFGFTAIVDFLLGLEVDGLISGFMTQYMVNGEPYLNCAFESVLCYYDIVALYPMYLLMMYKGAAGKSFRSLALYWSGALTNSLVTSLPAVFAGKYGVYPSTLLNAPYIIAPLVIGWRTWHRRPPPEGSPRRKNKQVAPPLLQRPLDLLLLLGLVLCILLAIVRGLAALGAENRYTQLYVAHLDPLLLHDDPAPFQRVQALQFLFYFVPLYFLSGVGFAGGAAEVWLHDLTLVHAGLALTSQFALIATVYSIRTPPRFRPASPLLFWSANLLPLLWPHLLLLRSRYSNRYQRHRKRSE